MEIDEIGTVADQCDVSRGRVIIWEKEGRKVCAVCGGPVIRAAYNQPARVDFRVKAHEAKIST
nr:hypothetical protein [uncultured bacterium]